MRRVVQALYGQGLFAAGPRLGSQAHDEAVGGLRLPTSRRQGIIPPATEQLLGRCSPSCSRVPSEGTGLGPRLPPSSCPAAGRHRAATGLCCCLGLAWAWRVLERSWQRLQRAETDEKLCKTYASRRQNPGPRTARRRRAGGGGSGGAPCSGNREARGASSAARARVEGRCRAVTGAETRAQANIRGLRVLKQVCCSSTAKFRVVGRAIMRSEPTTGAPRAPPAAAGTAAGRGGGSWSTQRRSASLQSAPPLQLHLVKHVLSSI